MRLNFFFDIDGTLLPVGGEVPASTSRALEKAKAMGHRLFLSTGRSQHEIPRQISSLPLDGSVFSSGAAAVYHGNFLYQKHASMEQRHALWDAVDRFGLLWLHQGPEGTYTTKEGNEYYTKLVMDSRPSMKNVPKFIIVDRYTDDMPISKTFLLSPDRRMQEVFKALKGYFQCVPDTTGLPIDQAAEVTLEGVTKASGITEVLKCLGDPWESSVAVGDGENDLEMVRYCHLGIAMGNACRILKDNADYVTTDIMEDGIANAIDYAIGRGE